MLFTKENHNSFKLISIYVLQDTTDTFSDSKKYDLPGYAVSC